MEKCWINITLMISLSLFPLAGMADANYYKYQDKEGHTVISNSLPPEIANDGYQIISPQGNVIETVAPRKTDLEINQEAFEQKKREEAERQAQIERQQAELQARKDDILLKSFSSETDIERARNDKISSIEVLEEIIRENMTGLERQLKDAKNAVLTYQRTHQPIPPNLQKTIEESERQLKENHAFLERKKIEKQEIHTKYQKLMMHFKELQNQKAAPQPNAQALTPSSKPTPATFTQ